MVRSVAGYSEGMKKKSPQKKEEIRGRRNTYHRRQGCLNLVIFATGIHNIYGFFPGG